MKKKLNVSLCFINLLIILIGISCPPPAQVLTDLHKKFEQQIKKNLMPDQTFSRDRLHLYSNP